MLNRSLLLRYLTSLPFLGVALLVLFGWLTLSLHSRSQQESEQAAPAKARQPKREPQGLVKDLGEKALALAVPTPPAGEAPKAMSEEVKKTLLALPAPISLYGPAAPPAAITPAVSSRFLPFGTMIPCKLVNTVDSNADGTPVVGIVLEDMRNLDEQRVSQIVIPAGTLAILESTAPGRERDRIAADGTWVFVWRNRDESNGLELPVSGRALAREYDPVTGFFGHDDGRAGLRGEVIEDLEARRTNAAALAFIDAGLGALKEYDVSSNALTGQVVRNPLPNIRNAALSGAGAYVQQYADQVRQKAAQDASYVRVRAGTEFYIFPRETVDLRNARRGSMVRPNATNPVKK
jgi:type IV secretory pathway VirB10-like protein